MIKRNLINYGRIPPVIIILIIIIVIAGAVAYFVYFGKGGTLIPGVGGPPSYEELVKKATEYKVEYRMTGKGMSGKYTIAIKGDKYKLWMKFEKGEYMVISTPESTITCVKGPGGRWMCFKGEKIPVPKVSSPQEIKEPKGKIEYVGERTVAGEKCYCWKIIPETAKGETITCLTNDGIPAYIESKMDSEVYMVLEAEKIYRSVSEDEFKPPAIPR